MRPSRLLPASLLTLSALSAVAAPQPTGLTTLAELRDQSRPLLIFAARPDDPQMGIQLRTLKEHAAEAHDRDVVGIALPYHAPSPSDLQLSAADAEAARRRFHVPPNEFTVILLGKDGGAKLRSSKPLTMRRLDDTIGAMPMRQDEMRARAAGAKADRSPKGAI